MIASKTQPSLALGSFSFRAEVTLATITLIGFALRAARLDFQPLWWDEGYSLFFATRDFGTLLARTAVDIHPPLYYALLQLWIALAGKSDVAVRLLSVIIGVAAIPLLYALARKLFTDTRIALLAAFLLALSPLHVYYSQEVRMYGLVTLLGIASVYLFVTALEQTAGSRQQAVAIAYILTTVAALYTQYYAAFLVTFEIVVIAVAAILRLRSGQVRNSQFALRITHYAISWLALAALYLPWLVYAGPKLYTYVTGKVAHEAYAPLDPLTFLAQHLAAFSVGHLTAWTWLAWGSVVLIALAMWGSIQVYKYIGRQVNKSPVYLSTCLPVYLYLLVPLALGYLVNLRFPFHPIRVERLLLLAAPAFYLLVALGIHALWKRRAWLGALALAIVSLISAASLYDFYTAPRYPNDDYRPLIAEVQTQAQSGDLFMAIYPWQIGYLETYYAGAPLTIVETPNDAWINNPAQMQRDLDALLAQQPRVWLPALQTLGRILEDRLAGYLHPRLYSIMDNWYGTTRLELFARAADPPRAGQAIAFEDGVKLSDWGVSREPVAAGQDIVRVQLDWGNNVPVGLNASLRLLDSKGNLWAQDDREITRGRQRVGFAIPAGTPPGEYDLRLAIYRAGTGGTTPPLQPAGMGGGTPPLLARVAVVAPAQPNLAAILRCVVSDFANDMRLLGYDASGKPIRPGEPTAITLYWQATRALDADYTVVLQIQDARGNIFADTQATPARGIYPTTRWQAHELVRDPQTLTLRGDAPDGDYRIVVGLIDSQSRVRVKTSNGREAAHIGTIAVKGRPHYFGAPAPSRTFDARFGETAHLVGYDLAQEGRAVRLVLYWQALATVQTSYTVFVHLLDENGVLRAQRDQIPGVGAYPTTSWVKGEYLVDVYDIAIPRDAPAGGYKIAIGMYDAKTGTRLPAFDALHQLAGDHIVLPTRISVAQ